MSRKHNCKKNTRSNYMQRLRDRGISKTPIMLSIETLRARQPKRENYNPSDSRYYGLTFGQKAFGPIKGSGGKF